MKSGTLSELPQDLLYLLFKTYLTHNELFILSRVSHKEHYMVHSWILESYPYPKEIIELFGGIDKIRKISYKNLNDDGNGLYPENFPEGFFMIRGLYFNHPYISLFPSEDEVLSLRTGAGCKPMIIPRNESYCNRSLPMNQLPVYLHQTKIREMQYTPAFNAIDRSTEDDAMSKLTTMVSRCSII